MSSVNPFNDLENVKVNYTGATDSGTKINKSGNELDKNSFLKILTAELSNQDPDNAKDSTEYVAQLAQFSSLEQMQNLNDTMTFASASNLVGKTVNLNSYDEKGNVYSGVVESVAKKGDNITLKVKTGSGDNDYKDFSYSDVTSIQQK